MRERKKRGEKKKGEIGEMIKDGGERERERERKKKERKKERVRKKRKRGWVTA